MTNNRAETAIAAFEAGRRRRQATGAIERAADAALAAGGALIANAVLPLGFGLPSGRAGLSMGASLLCAGLAWMTRHRGSRKPERIGTLRLRAPRPVAIPIGFERAA